MHRISTIALVASIGLGLAACNQPSNAPTAADDAMGPADTMAPADTTTRPDTTDMPPATDTMAPAADTMSPAAGTADASGNFKANGFSPAWRAEVSGDAVKLDVPEHNRVDPGFNNVTAKRETRDGKTVFTGKDGNVDFTLTIDASQRCQRASDENGNTDREATATLKYGKTTYQGCADRQ